MALLEINDNNFDSEVLKSNKTVLIDFYADWCGPCKMMSPIIDEISKEMSESIKVGKINIDTNVGLAEKYDIVSIPTIMIIKNGEVSSRFIGVTSKEVIKKALLV